MSIALKELPYLKTLTETNTPRNDELAAPTLTESVEKDLNLKNDYVKDRPLSIGEHLQNWLDGCYATGVRLEPKFKRLSAKRNLQTLKEGPWEVNICTLSNDAKQSPTVLGWLAIKDLGNGLMHVEMMNAMTALDFSKMLVIGYTTKRDSTVVAGYFGEGAKVEVNQLVNKGAMIAYYTNQQRWDFVHKDSVLHAKIEPGPSLISEEGLEHHTLIVMENIPKSAYDPNRFLFLSKASEENVFENEVIQIWMNPGKEHQNKVFVHGIYVSQLSSTKPDFSVNLICPKDQLHKYGVQRDRNSVSESDVIKAMIPLIENARNDQRAASLLSAVYHILYSSYVSFDRRKVFLKMLMEEFTKRHGKETFAVESGKVDSEKRMMMRLLNMRYQEVSWYLYNWLQHSDDFISIDDAIRRKQDLLLMLAEYVIDGHLPSYPIGDPLIANGTDFTTLQQVKRFAYHFFHEDEEILRKLRFKRFPFEKKQITADPIFFYHIKSKDYGDYFFVDAKLLLDRSNQSADIFVKLSSRFDRDCSNSSFYDILEQRQSCLNKLVANSIVSVSEEMKQKPLQGLAEEVEQRLIQGSAGKNGATAMNVLPWLIIFAILIGSISQRFLRVRFFGNRQQQHQA